MITLNGTSDFLRMTTAPLTTRPFTFCFWARVTSLAATARMGGLFDPTTVHNYSLAFTTTGVLRFTARDAGTSNADTTNTAAANTWAHCCARSGSANSDRTATLDGNIAGQGTSAVSRAPTVTAFSIGVSDISTKADWFPGQVAFPALWNVKLTDDEVVQLAIGRWYPPRIRRSALLLFNDVMFPTPRDIFGGSWALTGGAATGEAPPVAWG